MKNTNEIIIIGTSHHNTLSMVRCLGEQDIYPVLILYGSNDSYILSSKYLSKYFIANDSNNALKLLVENFGNNKEKSVVISCSDEISHILNQNYTRLKGQFHFFNCGADNLVTKFMNKNLQVEYARKVEINVPATIQGSVKDIDISKIENYPCIIKPLESINGGKIIRICNNGNEVCEALNSFEKNTKLLIQEYIKKEYEVVLLGLAVNNEVYIPGYIYKHRDIMGGTTYSTVKASDDIPEVLINSCKKLCKEFNYEGLFGIEMIKSGSDFYFIEMNLRNDATTYALAVAGVNLPIAYYKYVSSGNYREELNKTVNEINAIVEFNDIIHLLKRKISLIQWIRELKTSKCRYFYNKKDIKPYKIKRKEFILGIFKRFLN